MAWWPFSRKRRKTDPGEPVYEKASRSITTRPATRQPSPDRRDIDVRDAEKAARANSPTARASRRANQQIERARTSTEDITALPAIRDAGRAASPHLRQAPDPLPQRAFSRQSGRASRQSNRPSTESKSIVRPLSSKSKRRTKDGQDREEQVRQMSSPIPIPRPNRTDQDALASIQERNNRRRISVDDPDADMHGSLASLPAPSARSSITGLVGVEESHRFEVGNVDLFSARPIVRYSWSANQPLPSGASAPARSNQPSRQDSAAQNRTRNVTTPSRNALRESRTVDKLAEKYDSHGIRELMERDARRRDRRRQVQEENARRRLERAVARQEQKAANAGGAGEGSSRAAEGNPFVGLGLEGVEDGAISPITGEPRPIHPLEQPEESNLPTATEEAETRDPFQDPPQQTSSPFADPEPPSATARQNSTASASVAASTRHTRNPSTISQGTGGSIERRPSETSSRRGGTASGGFAAFFRRGKRTPTVEERSPFSPSEASFSNTSRESMGRQPLPAHLREQAVTSVPRSGTPTRTRSKFREDLPEGPQEVVEPMPAVPVPIPGREQQREPPKTPEDKTEAAAAASEALLSKSLASVDSEGSWLSGKPTPRKRMSQQMSPSERQERVFPLSTPLSGRTSALGERSTPLQPPAETVASTAAAASPDPVEASAFARASVPEAITEASTSADGENSASPSPPLDTTSTTGEQIVRGNFARRPTIVQRDSARKSAEGLLTQLGSDTPENASTMEGTTTAAAAATPAAPSSNGSSGESAEPPQEDHYPTTTHQGQARHVRQISSGSARLFEVQSRSGRSTPRPPPSPELSRADKADTS